MLSPYPLPSVADLRPRRLCLKLVVLIVAAAAGCGKEDPHPGTVKPPVAGQPSVSPAGIADSARCIRAIYSRLASVRTKYPELSELENAAITSCGLTYHKGRISWPRTKDGHPEFSIPSGCHMVIRLAWPVPKPLTAAQNDQGSYYPKAKLHCSFYFFHRRKTDGTDPFEREVQAVIREEASKLADILADKAVPAAEIPEGPPDRP